jgi:hypothetical protein
MPTYSNPFAHAQPAPNPLLQTQGSFNPHPRSPLCMHRRLTTIIQGKHLCEINYSTIFKRSRGKSAQALFPKQSNNRQMLP